MASSLEFVEYAAGQLAGAGEITWKRMFGEYGLYCNGLFFAVICDNQLFVKMTERMPSRVFRAVFGILAIALAADTAWLVVKSFQV